VFRYCCESGSSREVGALRGKERWRGGGGAGRRRRSRWRRGGGRRGLTWCGWRDKPCLGFQSDRGQLWSSSRQTSVGLSGVYKVVQEVHRTSLAIIVGKIIYWNSFFVHNLLLLFLRAILLS
jgi:hypothetical protein